MAATHAKGKDQRPKTKGQRPKTKSPRPKAKGQRPKAKGPRPKIYFAGAIRGGRGDSALYLEIIEVLGRYGHVLTEHIGDPELTSLGEVAGDNEIHDRDLSWVKEARYLVAEVTTPSLGVGFEIGKATEWGKPTLCLFRPGEGRKLSAMIAGSGGVIVREYQRTADLNEIFDEFFDVALSAG